MPWWISSEPPRKYRISRKCAQLFLNAKKIMSTGVGNGFAIPHGKTEAVSDIVAAFAITKNPIDYQALDDQPVRLIFLWWERQPCRPAH